MDVRPFLTTAVLLGAAVACGCAEESQTTSPGAPRVLLQSQPGEPHFGSVEATDLDPQLLARLKANPPGAEEWRRLFPVYAGALPATAGAKPPVLGTYAIEADRLRFTPRFPLLPGTPYFARLALDDEGEALVARFSLPKPGQTPSTRLTAIYPSADRLPENQLKFTLHFSAPMRRGEAYENLSLVDEEGQALADPFLEVEQELWDPAGERFTLFLHPGRIKRGLRPHAEEGSPLVAGRSYRLVISADWPDGAGQPLVAPVEKAFVTVAADRVAPDPERWQIEAPRAGSRDVLRVRFHEPLDHALLEHTLAVLEAGTGRPVAGEISIGKEERSWALTPGEPWRAGSFVLAVERMLEDLAGNNLNGLFDVELGVDPPARSGSGPAEIPFEVRTGG